ncbi:Phosphatidylinositol-3-phosphate phosphatase [Intoshia linei]|uniref:Phosphatidylinositol-3-phosphate phosphatase n=1 Tax=Intoshia linei TaxID=1819745 RepID=A0A177BDB3_9BILA|nr:Phosphatidylinositol-3-phosphate phosphatase [Intoshia linei]
MMPSGVVKNNPNSNVVVMAAIESIFDIIDGEIFIMKEIPTSYNAPEIKPQEGFLYLTNYRILYKSTDRYPSIEQPVYAIGYIDIKRTKLPSQFDLICKDMSVLSFDINNEDLRKNFLIKIQQMTFATKTSELFAFKSKEKFKSNGWKIYDSKKEYKRMNLPNELWKLSDVNLNYEFCETYPNIICIPNDENTSITYDLHAVGEFRSKKRIPVLSWLHQDNKATLCRGSQPLIGVNRSSTNDENYLLCIVENTLHAAKLLLVDARPIANAVANKFVGGGVENARAYDNVKVIFQNIHNIHVMRDSVKKIKDIIFPHIDDDNWFLNIDQSRWLDHIRIIIEGAIKIAVAIHKKGQSVFVHCSDGWDRTAQLTSLSMLMLDPYYRTFEGFQVLIEKEWISFGHKFQDRSGHGDEKPLDGERSPIFMQFIEVVWHISQQFETSFEFNEIFLLEIVNCLYNCRFGTFLCNCEFERKNMKLEENTQSVWSLINDNKMQYLNPLYNHLSEKKVIIPVASPVYIQFWNGLYLKNNPLSWSPESLSIRSSELIELRNIYLKLNNLPIP